jgi:hypothetical protein
MVSLGGEKRVVNSDMNYAKSGQVRSRHGAKSSHVFQVLSPKTVHNSVIFFALLSTKSKRKGLCVEVKK